MKQCKVQHQHLKPPFPPMSDEKSIWYCLRDAGHTGRHRFGCGHLRWTKGTSPK